MVEGIEIKGGASEFEAAVIAVVIDRINQDHQAAREARGTAKSGLPAWMRALSQERPDQPKERVWPQ